MGLPVGFLGEKKGQKGDSEGSYRPWLEAEADEEKDLCHQDGEGQVGMDVVALVTDGAHRPAGGGISTQSRNT